VPACPLQVFCKLSDRSTHLLNLVSSDEDDSPSLLDSLQNDASMYDGRTCVCIHYDSESSGLGWRDVILLEKTDDGFLACDGSSDHRGRPILHRHLGAWQLTFALCFALCHKLACSPSSLLAASGASAAASQQLPAAAALRSCCWPSPKFPPCSWSEPEMGDRRLKLRPPKLLCAAAHAVSDSGLALEIQLSHAADLEPARQAVRGWARRRRRRRGARGGAPSCSSWRHRHDAALSDGRTGRATCQPSAQRRRAALSPMRQPSLPVSRPC
jgi:hypothetical protein